MYSKHVYDTISSKHVYSPNATMHCTQWSKKYSHLVQGNGKIHLYSAAYAHTAFSGAVVADRATVQPRPQQVKPAHTGFDVYCHTPTRSPSLPFK